jgi:hypothetical protein
VTRGDSLQELAVCVRVAVEQPSPSSHIVIGPIAMASNHCRIAAVQAAPVSFDLHESLAKLSELTATSKAGGADLVVFPLDSPTYAWISLANCMVVKGFSLPILGGIILMSLLDLENLVVGCDFIAAERR